MPDAGDPNTMAAWFAGPKAENGEWITATIGRIMDDYYAWRRNYFPGDGVIIDSTMRRKSEAFRDAFDDRLLDLLARLKGDFPFYSPRYAAHMLADQTLPSIAGYFAAMLYNPNNVSSDAAPVTVRLELEAARMIADMLGYGPRCWAHLTSGGTIANIESLWIARTVRYLPLVIGDMRRTLNLRPEPWPVGPDGLLRLSPGESLKALERCFADAAAALGPGEATTRRAIRAYLDSPFNVVERGLHAVQVAAGSNPVVVVPETHHYCFDKAMDALGLGRRSLVRVPVDAEFRMRIDALDRALEGVHARGDHVLAVIAVVGTTEEGAIDPIDGILDLRARRERDRSDSFWLHVDAAYGGYLRTLTIPERAGLGEANADVKVGGKRRRITLTLPERGACTALERLGECDSIAIDPHKLGYIPYPAGAVCFKSDLVKPIARQDAPYIDDAPGDVESESRAQGIGVYILEGSKPGAAAAAVWLSHSLIPLNSAGHGSLIRETIRNACELHALLEGYHEFVPDCPVRAVCLCPPGSNIVCYAFRPSSEAGHSLPRLNEANRRIYEKFTLGAGEQVYDHSYFVSRTTLSARQYGLRTVAGFLDRLGVDGDEYAKEGVFLLRSVLMNPWYEQGKQRDRYFVSELAGALYRAAAEELGEGSPSPRRPARTAEGP